LPEITNVNFWKCELLEMLTSGFDGQDLEIVVVVGKRNPLFTDLGFGKHFENKVSESVSVKVSWGKSEV